ncbi:hypothetical protein [Thalassotalea fusca]
MKYLSAIAIVILLLCGGAMWFLASGSINAFIKNQIETQGSSVLAVPVKVAAVDIRLSQAAGTIEQVTIDNVAGFSTKKLYQLDHITLDINLKSLKESPLVVDAINVDGSLLNIEVDSDGRSNIQVLKKQINLPEASPNEKEVEVDETKDRKIKITQLSLTNINAQLDLSALGGDVHQITLPRIALSNIGGDNGVPTSKLGQVILGQLVDKIWQETKAIQSKKLEDKLKNKLQDKVSDKLKSLIQ